MANGPDGLVISDNHSSDSREQKLLQKAFVCRRRVAPGKEHQNGTGQSGLPRLGRTLKGPDYDTDQEWHLRNKRYGDGWAYRFHSEPLEASKADLRQILKMTGRQTHQLPMGSTSKTYDPRKDGSFWQRTDRFPRLVTFFLCIRTMETEAET